MSDYDAPPPAPKIDSTPRIIGMRDSFFEALFSIFREDDRCFFITADNGAPTLDPFAKEFPRRFAQVGIAEQQLVGMAAGLAMEGWKVWAYAIAPFVTTRVHEFWKLDCCAMNLDVCLLGVGAGYAYDIMGPSHHTVEDIAIMRPYANATVWSPADPGTARQLARWTRATPGPQYVRFDRVGLTDLTHWTTAGDGWRVRMPLGRRPEVSIVTTGVTAHTATKVAAELLVHQGIACAVYDVWRPVPFPTGVLRHIEQAGKPNLVVVLEEHMLRGGLGSIVLEEANDAGIGLGSVLRLGVPGETTYTYGGREAIWEKYGLTVDQVIARISGRIR